MFSINDALKNRLQNWIIPLLPFEIKQKEQDKQLSYAFNLYAMATILDIDINDTFQWITEGAGDNGIDGIYINGNTIYFFQSKYFKNIEKQIGENEVKKILNTITDIFNNKELLNSNERLMDKIKAIKKILNESTEELNIRLYLITNTKNNTSIEINSKVYLDEFKEKNNLKYEDITTATLFSLFNDIEKEDKKFNTTITSIDGYIDTKITDTTTYIMNVKARELIRIYEDCGRERMFVNNVRYFLEYSNINQQIKDTIKDKDLAQYFYLFNNGISIIVENIETALSLVDENGNKKFKITNPFIVNGGQTTKTLYNLYKENEESLKDIKVLVKFYKTTEQSLIDKIIIGTNTQNSIYIRDLYANDKMQREIQIFFKNRNIGFEIKRGEFNKSRNIYDDIIANDVLMQSYISLYDNKPHVAKNNKSSLFYKEFKLIFNEKNSDLAFKLFRSYELYKFTINNKNKYKEYSFLEYSTFYILYCMTLLDNSLTDIKLDLNVVNTNSNNLTNLYNKSIEIINNIVKNKAEKNKEAYSNTLFFKSLEATNLINEYVNNIK